MCYLIGLLSTWWNPTGLFLDFIGVLLLGFDLVRVQRYLRTQARNDLDRFEAMVDEYGGTESWIEEISKNTGWINQSQYERYHAEDEVSFNTHHAVDQLGELALCLAGLAGPITKIILFQKEQAESNSRLANASIRYSVVGLVLIFVGFVMQFIGAINGLHCS